MTGRLHGWEGVYDSDPGSGCDSRTGRDCWPQMSIDQLATREHSQKRVSRRNRDSCGRLSAAM